MSRSTRWIALASVPWLVVVTPAVRAATVLYVDDDAGAGGDGLSWATAYADLQDALATAAASGGTMSEIRVAGGTYRPDRGQAQTPGDQAASFKLLNNLTVRGGYAGIGAPDPDLRDVDAYPSTLSGDLAGDDETGGSNAENSYHPVVAPNVDRTAVLDGFTITGGNAQGPPNSGHNLGGGLYAQFGSPTVIGCRFIRNTARAGGGAYCRGGPAFIDCLFRENQMISTTSSGGGLYCIEGDAEIRRCAFIANTSVDHAGGVLLREGAHLVADSDFIENVAEDLGGGLQLYDTDTTLVNCRFLGNFSARRAGGIYIAWRGHPQIMNCVFIANRSGSYGGAIYNWWNTTTLTNCVLVANKSGISRANGIYNAHLSGGTTACYVTNSILWNNGGVTEEYQSSSDVNITYSCVQGGWTGSGRTGVIDADPLFRRTPDPGDEGWGAGGDDDYGDMHLLPGSPCLDAGNNSVDTDRVLAGVQPLPAFDLDNGLRIVDDPIAPDVGVPPVVDMGPYEYQEDCNGNTILDSADLASGSSLDCNANLVPDECEPPDDCDGNGVQDICDLAAGAPDCNRNAVIDSCDIASGASEDLDGSGVPDECERTLTGYWRMDLTYTLAGCDWFSHFFDQVRYLRFDENSELIESWILADGKYLRLNYPSTDGPSLNRFMGAEELTANTDRVISAQSLVSYPWKWELTESVSVNDGSHNPEVETTAEHGTTKFKGKLDFDGTRLTGTWEFRDSYAKFCGDFMATRLAGPPPDLPAIVDLGAAELTLSATELPRPGTVDVTTRAYRVRSSFLSSPVEIRYLLSTDTVADAGDVLVGAETVLPGPDAGLGLHTGPGPMLTLPDCVPWTHQPYILLVVDATDELAETAEDNNVAAIPVTVVPPLLLADFDGDCDVDADDFSWFEACAAGPAVPLTDEACLAADFDLDMDADQTDFATLQRAYRHPNVEIEPSRAP